MQPFKNHVARGVIAATIAAMLTSGTALAGSGNANDEAAIRALILENAGAWEKGSGEAFAAQFSEDADYIPPTGARFSGKEAIKAQLQRAFDRYFKGATLRMQVQDIRFIENDIAVAHVLAGIAPAGSVTTEAPLNSIQTYVLAKKGGAWRIEAFQNTYIEEPRERP